LRGNPSLSNDRSEIEVELDLKPICYKIEVHNPKNFDKERARLMSFILANDAKLQQVAAQILEMRRKNLAKVQSSVSVECRLPAWFYQRKLSLPDAVALLLFFVEKPMNTRQLTTLVNTELKGKKKDLRNVSKIVTSRGKALYGHVAYDSLIQTYTLNKYGKNWVEHELIPRLINRQRVNNGEDRKDTKKNFLK
jgi:hypothetical protein